MQTIANLFLFWIGLNMLHALSTTCLPNGRIMTVSMSNG